MTRFFPRLFIFGFIFSIAATPAFSQPENYCHDQKAAGEWEALVKGNPDDLVLQRLHALRLGICEKIEAGSLTFNQGMQIFEQEREKAVQKRFEVDRQKKRLLVQ